MGRIVMRQWAACDEQEIRICESGSEYMNTLDRVQ